MTMRSGRRVPSPRGALLAAWFVLAGLLELTFGRASLSVRTLAAALLLALPGWLPSRLARRYPLTGKSSLRGLAVHAGVGVLVGAAYNLVTYDSGSEATPQLYVRHLFVF